jgi:hypothetical protein
MIRVSGVQVPVGPITSPLILKELRGLFIFSPELEIPSNTLDYYENINDF